MIRDGYVARWRGTDYDAVPGVDGEIRLYTTAPEDGFTEVRTGRYVRVLGGGEVEGLRYVRTRCTFRGAPFAVIGAHGDWVRLEYTGGRAPVATSLDLEMVDIGVYQTWAPRDQIEDVHEQVIS